jgi:hypothetical protein
MKSTQAQGHWAQIVAAVLVLVIIVVTVLIFTGVLGQSKRDIGQCELVSFGDKQGRCMTESTCKNEGVVSRTFSKSCQPGTVCCMVDA